MFTALKQLGFHPCHGTNMWEDPKKFLTLWTEAMKAKYMGEGKPWGRKELDVVLGNFDVGRQNGPSIPLGGFFFPPEQ